MFCCNNREEIRYTKADIYCWCMSFIPADDATPNYLSPCETFAAVKPSDLIRDGRRSSSVTDGRLIASLKNIIFNQKKSSEISELRYPDSRFLILFRRGALGSDTVVYSYPNEFYFNGKDVFKYSFNVIDAIRPLLGDKAMVCPE